MDKQKILDAISLALDELAKEPPHLVLDWELRNIKNEQWTAEVQIKNGVLVRFNYYDVPIARQDAENGERAHRQYDEPDRSNWALVHHPLYDTVTRQRVG